jgi:hypothetical protein
MQNQKIILLPPTHEQTPPSFHVEGSLAERFLAFLKSRGVEAWQPPEVLEKTGPDAQQTVEIAVEPETPLPHLETLMKEFLGAKREADPSVPDVGNSGKSEDY